METGKAIFYPTQRGHCNYDFDFDFDSGERFILLISYEILTISFAFQSYSCNLNEFRSNQSRSDLSDCNLFSESKLLIYVFLFWYIASWSLQSNLIVHASEGVLLFGDPIQSRCVVVGLSEWGWRLLRWQSWRLFFLPWLSCLWDSLTLQHSYGRLIWMGNDIWSFF